jgi:hypothetical protein
MDRGIVIELIPQKDADLEKVVVELANGRPVDLSPYEVRIVPSPIDAFRPAFMDYIRRRGITSYVCRELVTEAIVAPGAARNDVQELVKSYVDGLGIDQDLLIIDPYFFAPTEDSYYADLLAEVLSPVLAALRTLRVVTLPGKKADQSLIQTIKARLQRENATLQLLHSTSKSFHDRFWINQAAGKGFLTGTSLNGLGKRYALVDHLNEVDVKAIVTAAESEGHIPKAT